jgi:hypothetical protein
MYISKLVPRGSRARPQSETTYLRPEIDILYFPDLITLDAAQFGANADSQANVRNLPFGPHPMKYLGSRTRSGQMIRSMENLKTMYTLRGSTILSDGFRERLFCAELTMKDVKKGELYSGPVHNGPWNSGCVEYVEECYRRFHREMVAYGRWRPPKLVCKEIKRDDGQGHSTTVSRPSWLGICWEPLISV